ncbi:MAG: LysM peptidoglycan-binding domain-containing protein [Verrucomicrobiales bacterium]|nr:LysM peptidoglycan-binding domain-containing protein [Verrucomicrobiales bacterium]
MFDRLLLATLPALLALTLASCDSTGSSSSGSGSPFSGPRPTVSGSSARPVNHLPNTEYPFDAKGKYITSWAAAGDKKYGAVRSSTSRSSSSRSSSSRSKRPSKPRYRTHTVKKGDTLWGLSKRYGKSVSSIKSTSGIRSDNIRIGQRLKIPR